MTSKSNLPKRVARARSAAQFIGTVGSGKNVTYRVPGSDGKSYRVKVRRDGVLSFQCWQDHDGSPCRGNENGTVCYHSLATAEKLARDAGKSVSWCANDSDARNLSHLGGRVFRVVSHTSESAVWGVACD